ncbi:MAG: hypothetical protein P8Y66_07205 [Nitrospirota bacterium]|jgi:putative oxidoreductase
MQNGKRVALALVTLRAGVFVVMFMWTLDKFVNASHSAGVFRSFYGVELGEGFFYAVGALEMLLIVAFALGLWKRLSYGLVLLMHLASTLAAWKQYLNPWELPNLLFFAAWPMLAACFALYYLRDMDVLWVVRKPRPAGGGLATSE